ncbi:MAG: hypothetical protein G01um101417_276 [Parcubacteria group bacterium Gr01-1014_17]|nr:MAG: hypothetical protein G01um101417_276 [Parcubacteria group bacterium Gr01-1014_17]
MERICKVSVVNYEPRLFPAQDFFCEKYERESCAEKHDVVFFDGENVGKMNKIERNTAQKLRQTPLNKLGIYAEFFHIIQAKQLGVWYKPKLPFFIECLA